MDIFLYTVQQDPEFTVLALRGSQAVLFVIINKIISNNSCILLYRILNFFF